MHPDSFKALIAGTLAAVLMAGCASTPSSSSPASTQRSSQSGKVVGVERGGAHGQSAAASSSGGSSASGTTVGSESTMLTVLFADGTERAYNIEQPTRAFVVGTPVQVITDGETITIVSP